MSDVPVSTIANRVLTDIEISDLFSLRKAIRALHHVHRVPNVVISSIPLKPWLMEALPPHARIPSPEEDGDKTIPYLLCISSSAEDEGKGDSPSAVHIECIPCIPGYFSGVGDLFSALVLAHFKPPLQEPIDTKNTANGTVENALSSAVAHALIKTHAILHLTHTYALSLPESERQPTDDELDQKDQDRKVRRMKGRELRLVQGQDIIRGTVTVEHTGKVMDPWLGFWDE